MSPRRGPRTVLYALLLFALAALPPAAAQVDKAGRSTGLPVPRFASLASDRVNVRFGPGKEFEIAWVFARDGLPVKIIAEFDTWRKIEDFEGATGWIHASLLSGRRTVMIRDQVRELKRTAEDDARIVLRAEPGVIGRLFDCEGSWCRVEIAGSRGWLRRDEFFGALPDEVVS